MSIHHRINRRDLLRSTAAVGIGLAIPTTLFGQQCEKTPGQLEGPFYMNTWDRTKPVPHQNDLTWAVSPDQPADGDAILLVGQITDKDCRPMGNAMVEIWQACATGRYAHAADPNPARLDPNFRYFGEFLTDENGMYSFKTIKPGAYPVGNEFVRPSHVHFKITAGLRGMLTTQMYFAGDPWHSQDPLLNSVSKAEQKNLIVEPTREDGSDIYTFNATVIGFG